MTKYQIIEKPEEIEKVVRSMMKSRNFKCVSIENNHGMVMKGYPNVAKTKGEVIIAEKYVNGKWNTDKISTIVEKAIAKYQEAVN